MGSRRDEILDTIEDMVAEFLYYDRKHDEELPRGAIEKAVSSNEITVEEMVDAFAVALKRGIDRGNG